MSPQFLTEVVGKKEVRGVDTNPANKHGMSFFFGLFGIYWASLYGQRLENHGQKVMKRLVIKPKSG